MTKKKGIKVVIAGGGTGGHFFPGLAMAEEFRLRDNRNDVFFIGTRKGIEAKLVSEANYRIFFLSTGGLMGKAFWQKMKVILFLFLAMLQSLWILVRQRPDLVFGVGGYASGPAVLAAWLLRFRTAILEENAVPGFTNRILGRIVDRVFISFPEAKKYFHRKKVFFSGNPVRRDLLNVLISPQGEKKDPDLFHILVLGGSQGARKINETFVKALDFMNPSLKEKLRVTHQTGERDFEMVRENYEIRNFPADVRIFIRDMAARYREASLLISRAGASTVAEITLCRKAAILVPYPYAAYGHQEANARALTERKAAIMIRDEDLFPSRLAKEVEKAFQNREALDEMGKRAGDLARPAAAVEIVEECYRLLGMKEGRGD